MKNDLRKLWLKWSQPIDWAALAADQKTGTRRGDKRALWETEKVWAARRRNLKRRQAEATERRLAAQKAQRRPAMADLRGRVALAVKPGEWVTLPAVRDRIPGASDYGAVKCAVWRAWQDGRLERREAAAWRAWAGYRKGLGIDRQLERPARYEYRLTARGRAFRAWVEREG